MSEAVSQQIELGFEQEASDTAWYDDEVLENKRFEKERFWAISSQDNSLSIHSCHNLQRQLEVLRIMIGRWLNEPVKPNQKKRHISDIVVCYLMLSVIMRSLVLFLSMVKAKMV